MNKQSSQRKTAAALGVLFGTKPPKVLRDVPRNKPTLTRKNKHGAAIQMLSFNEARKVLAAESKLFESDVELEKALSKGMKLKDGGSLRDSYFSPTGIPTKYAD